ncbi:sigma-54-dependent transcriptional regulator [Candidatus Laterigemmans baculatus]|uniref:sigma-54-dependent transcriptional regulator n=1 Tax=Candidatus Laterigemmans baculatus TaxID=2770505 RepID=UPI0013D96054|nr:sigma-54 dependent transcriptional regulator [Candidatus Laterigemmans baculatus]
MSTLPNLLLVDDDRHLAESMAQWLSEQEMHVDVAHSVEAGRRRLASGSYELLITDLRLDDGDGFELIGWAKKHCPGCEVLVVTGYATPQTAVEAVRAGAFDLLTKPLIDEELSLAISRALSHREIEAENAQLKQQLDRRFGLEHILGHDYRMLKIFDVIESVADARASVMITGENGTGKSMIARAIHRRSNRAEHPFVEVACGALPETLLESELFGHVAGAFTGAQGNKVGKFELADRGTLFLDEIGTASPALQVKLLRVLQELQFEPVGGTETRTVDTRVILATNENLAAAVREGRFRQDLFYRVNVINIELPPLRERVGDIPLLVDHFLRGAVATSGRQVEGFDRAAIERMQQYAWPGNVRELENVIERAVLLSRGSVLTVDDLPPEFHGGPSLPAARQPSGAAAMPGFAGQATQAASDSGWGAAPVAFSSSTGYRGQSLRDALEEPERRIILEALRRHEWNRIATAETLQINRTTLYKKMKRLGLDDPRLQFMA